jgi:hypothetical protein
MKKVSRLKFSLSSDSVAYDAFTKITMYEDTVEIINPPLLLRTHEECSSSADTVASNHKTWIITGMWETSLPAKVV